MIVAGLNRLLSTTASRSWPSDQREPAPGEIRGERALEALLGERAGMAQQAKALLTIRHDGAAAGRIAPAPVKRLRDGVPDDRERA